MAFLSNTEAKSNPFCSVFNRYAYNLYKFNNWNVVNMVTNPLCLELGSPASKLLDEAIFQNIIVNYVPIIALYKVENVKSENFIPDISQKPYQLFIISKGRSLLSNWYM